MNLNTPNERFQRKLSKAADTMCQARLPNTASRRTLNGLGRKSHKTTVIATQTHRAGNSHPPATAIRCQRKLTRVVPPRSTLPDAKGEKCNSDPQLPPRQGRAVEFGAHRDHKHTLSSEMCKVKRPRPHVASASHALGVRFWKHRSWARLPMMFLMSLTLFLLIAPVACKASSTGSKEGSQDEVLTINSSTGWFQTHGWRILEILTLIMALVCLGISFHNFPDDLTSQMFQYGSILCIVIHIGSIWVQSLNPGFIGSKSNSNEMDPRLKLTKIECDHKRTSMLWRTRLSILTALFLLVGILGTWSVPSTRHAIMAIFFGIGALQLGVSAWTTYYEGRQTFLTKSSESSSNSKEGVSPDHKILAKKLSGDKLIVKEEFKNKQNTYLFLRDIKNVMLVGMIICLVVFWRNLYDTSCLDGTTEHLLLFIGFSCLALHFGLSLFLHFTFKGIECDIAQGADRTKTNIGKKIKKWDTLNGCEALCYWGAIICFLVFVFNFGHFVQGGRSVNDGNIVVLLGILFTIAKCALACYNWNEGSIQWGSYRPDNDQEVPNKQADQAHTFETSRNNESERVPAQVASGSGSRSGVSHRPDKMTALLKAGALKSRTQTLNTEFEGASPRRMPTSQLKTDDAIALEPAVAGMNREPPRRSSGGRKHTRTPNGDGGLRRVDERHVEPDRHRPSRRIVSASSLSGPAFSRPEPHDVGGTSLDRRKQRPVRAVEHRQRKLQLEEEIVQDVKLKRGCSPIDQVVTEFTETCGAFSKDGGSAEDDKKAIVEAAFHMFKHAVQQMLLRQKEDSDITESLNQAMRELGVDADVKNIADRLRNRRDA